MGCSVKTGVSGSRGSGGNGNIVFSKSGITPANRNILYYMSNEEVNNVFKPGNSYIIAISLDELTLSVGTFGECYIISSKNYNYGDTVNCAGGIKAKSISVGALTGSPLLQNIGSSPYTNSYFYEGNKYSFVIIECAGV